jgi:4-coumarate--CoA ligase
MLFLGIVAAGGVFAGTNPSYTSYELSHAIRIAKVKVLIAEAPLLGPVLAAADACNIPQSQVFVFDIHEPWQAEGDMRSFRWLLEQGEADWERFDDKTISETTSVARLFSSGTTGMPKALDMSHYNFIAQHTMVLEYKPRNFEVSRLLCNPMFHVSIVPRAHTTPLRSGVVTYIMRRFDLESWLRYIWTYKITEINMVPPMVHAVLSRPDLTSKYPLKSVRNSWCGAAPLSREAQERFKKLLRDDAPFNQVWGMSETSCIATMTHYPEYDASGSSGKFLPDLDCKLVDNADNDITGYGVPGEICVRGPTIVRGYFENEEATRASWDEDGYFHTGDIAYCDPKTLGWHIVDRKKDLIKVRGFQVAPAELEGVLLSHPSIIDAAVIGVPKADGSSELPRAYVVKMPGAAVEEQDLHGFIGENLARYKRLDGGVVFVDSIPKNASGKILKVPLRERAKVEMRAKL